MKLVSALKKYPVPIALGLAVLLVFLLHTAKTLEIPFIRHIEAISYDARLRLTMPQTLDYRIVIVDIDEKSLAKDGRWPWGRDKLAVMPDQLFDRYHTGVSAVPGAHRLFPRPSARRGMGRRIRLSHQMRGSA